MWEQSKCALAVASLAKGLVALGLGEDLGLFFRIGPFLLGDHLCDQNSFLRLRPACLNDLSKREVEVQLCVFGFLAGEVWARQGLRV